ncbi:MAG: nitrilase-related carbon-nitrogen hydrolase, partial [Paracoccaceae bacterium]
RYDKIHMFDIQLSATQVYEESAMVSPGDSAALHETPWGMLGHTICYDVRFPHLYRDLSQAGAEMLAVPAAFTKATGEMHWHILNRARAIENGAFVIAPCAQGAVPGGGEAYGHSLIIDPMGNVLADGGEKPGVVMARIDLDDVATARAKIPSLSHDRPYQSANGGSATSLAAE